MVYKGILLKGHYMHFIGDVYISEMLRKQVLDPQGEEAGRLEDFFITLGELFPRVSGLLVQRKGTRYLIPWEVVNIFNKKVVSISVPADSLAPAGPGRDEISACRQVLDRQIVDINGAKVVRVNDLKLGEVKGHLCLIAADVGASGLFRRLGIKKHWEQLARLMGFKQTTNLISWNLLQPLEPKLGRLTLNVPRRQLNKLHPSDIAQIISDVPRKDRQAIMEALDIETAAETMHELEPSVQATIITQMDEAQAADILEEMPPDEAADLLADLPEDKAQGILKLMEAEEAEDVQELLEHEEDTAGGLMTTDYLSFPPGMTVEDALGEYKLEAPDIESASAYSLYVLDPEERLLGEVFLKDLLLAQPRRTLGEIMRTDFRHASPDADEMEVAEVISKYNLLALPVLEEDRTMLGIVTVDDVVDLILPPQSRRRKHRIG
ncbi:MAG TPA: CBS domain-containing protein [Nitrospirota bacterium]|nr:CBS domain-containing protein [Nitrospirota bacterium]